MIHPDLLEILCCPETHQPVREAPPELIARLNDGIRSGTMSDGRGRTVAEEIEGGLVRQDGRFVYPVRDGIPDMLIEDRLPVDPPAPSADPAPPGS